MLARGSAQKACLQLDRRRGEKFCSAAPRGLRGDLRVCGEVRQKAAGPRKRRVALRYMPRPDQASYGPLPQYGVASLLRNVGAVAAQAFFNTLLLGFAQCMGRPVVYIDLPGGYIRSC